MNTTLRTLCAFSIAVGSSLTVSTGCSLLGTPASSPDGLPHAGVGPYRDLTNTETNLSRGGVPVVLRNVAAERPMVAGLHLFYAGASSVVSVPDAGMPDAGDLDAGVADAGVIDAGPLDAGVEDTSGDIDWSRFSEGRRIYRSPPRDSDWGYDSGAEVLAPEGGPAWEGGYVTDPWALETPEGALLYYAAAGGIGVASSNGVDGTFSRVGDAPILGASGSDVPRCPAVIRTEGVGFAPPLDGGIPPSLFEAAAYYMVYELAGTLRYATSSDGRSFTDVDAIAVPALAARDIRDGTETNVGCPGVGIAEPSTGRRYLRIYYESRRDNDAVLLALMATSDGVTFEFYSLPVVLERDRRMPAPHVIDSRLSLLLQWRPAVAARVSVGELRVGLAPGGAVLTGGTR